jgi:hypothetical protein
MAAEKARDVAAYLTETLAKRIMYFDGGMGTMIQGYHLEEADFQGRIHAVSVRNSTVVFNVILFPLHSAFYYIQPKVHRTRHSARDLDDELAFKSDRDSS